MELAHELVTQSQTPKLRVPTPFVTRASRRGRALKYDAQSPNPRFADTNRVLDANVSYIGTFDTYKSGQVRVYEQREAVSDLHSAASRSS